MQNKKDRVFFGLKKFPAGQTASRYRARQSVRLRRVRASALLESSPDEQTRSERQRSNGVDRCRDAYHVCEDTGEKCASDIAQISPESVNADPNASPCGMRNVADCGDERRIDERRYDAQ